MSSVLVPRSIRRFRVAVAAVLGLLAPQLAAQQASTADGAAPAKDPGMVIARTVNPRIAYRAVPTEDNPIHSEATLFPSRTFHAAMDGTVGELLGDDALGARGSAGLHAGAATEAAMVRIFAGDSSPLGPGLGARTTGPGGVVGVAGAVGTTVGRAVGGSGATAGGLFGAMPGLMPTQQGGGP